MDDKQLKDTFRVQFNLLLDILSTYLQATDSPAIKSKISSGIASVNEALEELSKPGIDHDAINSLAAKMQNIGKDLIEYGKLILPNNMKDN